MRPLPRRRRRAEQQTGDPTEPLGRLRRRYAVGAIVTGTAYLATLATVALGPADIEVPVAIGLLVGFGTVAGLCTLGAMLTWAMGRLPDSTGAAQPEEIKWAIRFGEDLADAFRTTPAAGPGRK